MIERLQGKVETVKFIKNIGVNLDMCEIVIDFDTLVIFYQVSELMKFVGKDVLYTVRPDVVEGKTATVICELVELSTIHTISQTDNIKLIPEGTKRTVCNFSINKIRQGDFYPNCVALLSSFQLGSSNKAKWFDLLCIDEESHEFSLKYFLSGTDTSFVEDLLNDAKGRYINFDLDSTKYGYQTKEFQLLPNKVEKSPEVQVAEEVLRQIINNDEGLLEYEKKFDFIKTLSSVIDGEPGYVLVRMASEIYMINAIDSISTDLDIRAMKRAVFCSRGYLLPKKTEWSNSLLNTNKIITIGGLKTDTELRLILDVMANEEFSSTKKTYIKIRGLVDDIIKIRRGVKDEEINGSIMPIISMFNGLL